MQVMHAQSTALNVSIIYTLNKILQLAFNFSKNIEIKFR